MWGEVHFKKTRLNPDWSSQKASKEVDSRNYIRINFLFDKNAAL